MSGYYWEQFFAAVDSKVIMIGFKGYENNEMDIWRQSFLFLSHVLLVFTKVVHDLSERLLDIVDSSAWVMIDVPI